MGIVAWDEEALVVKNDDFYVDERVPEPNIRMCHRFFTRGKGDRAALVARYPDLADRLVATGNPRVDILSEQYIHLHDDPAIQTDKKRIMINSRFSHSNPAHKSAESFRRGQLRRLQNNPEAQRFKLAYMEYTDRLFAAFVDMVEQVAGSLPDYEIVVRPHPSEDEALWLGLASRYENLRVTKQSTATAWSLASDVTVHNGCTTAVEAALLGCNVLAFCPFRSEQYDVRLPNDVSECVASSGALIERIRSLPRPTAEHRAENARRTRQYVSRSIAGLCGERFASDLILDVLDRDIDYPSRGLMEIANCGAHRMFNSFRRAMLKWGLNPRERERQRKKDAYFKVKFAGLDKAEVEGILRRIGSPDVRVDEVRKDWVRLSAKEVD